MYCIVSYQRTVSCICRLIKFKWSPLLQSYPGVQAVPGQLGQRQWQSLLAGWLPRRCPVQPARTALPVESVGGGGGWPWGGTGPHCWCSQWLRHGRRIFLQVIEASQHHSCDGSYYYRHHYWEAIDNPAHHCCQTTGCCQGQWSRQWHRWISFT